MPSRLLFLLPLIGLGCDVAPGADEADDTDDFAAEDGEFTVAYLPDTQIYAQHFPATFDAQLRWIAEHAEAMNIVFVSHVGDIVNNGNRPEEWEVAVAAYDWLEDRGIPHGFSIAGHDVSGHGGFLHPHDATCSPFPHIDCDALDFKANFGADRYLDRPWFGGASPSGLSSWQVIDAEGIRLLFVHLPQDPPRAEVDWAHEVLDANPGTLAHLTTHRYLFDYRLTAALPPPLDLFPAGRFNEATYLLGGQSPMYLDGLKADEVFNELVATHPNIWTVHCGHVDAEFRQRSVNEAGLPVHEVLVDYQDMADGGGGFLRLLTYNPAKKTVTVKTVSATTGELRPNGAGYDHSIDILDAYQGAAAEYLSIFGLEQEDIDTLLTAARTEGDPLREAYRASLYDGGQRDSQFVLDVDFSAYVEASR